MRNLKKILAVITVVAMMATMMVIPALAESFTYENEAKVLNELGLMAGYNLGDEVTRVQGITFAIKAAGKASEVEAMSDEEAAQILADMVVDASEVPAWATKWVAYAVKNGYTSGVDASTLPKVKFAPMQKMTAAELLVWVMNVGMGYKVGTNNAVAKAVEAGIINLNQAMEFGPKAALIRDDIAGILYGACKNGVNADGTRFIESLIKAGFITEDAAIAAGFVEPKPAKLEVVGVSATNLKQLVVEFNMPIKEAGNQDNYSIETEDAQASIDKNSKFNLLDDKKTVVITLTDAAAQNEVIDLKVKGIESESGLKLDETIIEDIKMEDTTLPKAISAEVVGKYTIKVKFSEPIKYPVNNTTDGDDYFVVDDGDYIIEKIEKVNSDTELNIVLYSALEEGTITVEAKPTIKDYAGYGITKTVFTVDVVEDETAPVIVGYKNAKPTEVTLIFDEDIQLLGDPTGKNDDGSDKYEGNDEFLAKFYHTNKKNPAKDLKVDGKELTIKFDTEYKMTEGKAYLYIDKEVLQDLWENKNEKYSYVVDVTDDSEPPVVEKIEQEAEDAIKVVFNEEVNETAEDIDNYTLLDKDGKELDKIASVSERKDGNKAVVITFSEDLSGDYKLVVKGVEDVLENAMSKTTVAFTMKDKTAPNSLDDKKFEAKLYLKKDDEDKLVKNGQIVKVFFNDTMATDGKYSVLDLEKYEIEYYNNDEDQESKFVNLADVKNVKIKAVDNNRAVEITIPSDVDVAGNKDAKPGKDYLILKAGSELYIAKVADAAGNKTPGIRNELTLSDTTAVGVDKVEQTAKDTVVITFNDRLTSFEKRDFQEALESTTDAAVKIKSIRHTVNDDGYSVVTLILEDWNFTDASYLKLNISNAESTNKYGAGIAEVTDRNVADKAAPVVDKVYYVADAANVEALTGRTVTPINGDNKFIVIKFTEEIDPYTVSEKGNNGFTVTGGKAKLKAVYVQGQYVILEGENFSVNTDVRYDEAAGLTDKAVEPNAVKSFTKSDKLEEYPKPEE